MVDRVQGLVFEVEVDSASAEKNLKRFGATARSEVASVGRAAKSSGGQIGGLTDSTKVLGGESATAAQKLDAMKEQFSNLKRRADDLNPALATSAKRLAAVRAAALKLAAIAAIVAIVGKLYFEFVKLGLEVTKNTEAYKQFSSALDDSRNLIGNIAADVLGLEEGFSALALILEKINEFLEEFARRVQFARKITGGGVGATDPRFLLAAALTPDSFQLDRRRPAEQRAPGAAGAGGTSPFIQGGTTGLLGPQAQPFGFGIDEIFAADTALQNLTTTFVRWNELRDERLITEDQFAEGLAKITEEAERLQALGIEVPFVQLVNVAGDATTQLNFMAIAFRSLGDAIIEAGAALLISGRNTKEFLRQQAKTAAAYAIMTFAAGLAAKSGGLFGRIFGDYKALFAASAKFAGAAVAFGVASQFAGGSGGGGAGSSPTDAPFAATGLPEQTDTRQQEITIIIEGQGFIQDKETFAREIARSIQRETRAAGA